MEDGMVKRLLIVLLGFLFGVTGYSQTVISSHPRLLINQNTLGELRQKLQNQYHTEFQDFIDLCDQRFNSSEDGLAIRLAFLYQIGQLSGFNYGHTMDEYANRAKAVLMTEQSQGIIRGADPELVTAQWIIPLGYDWLYDRLSTSDKQYLVGEMIDMINKTPRGEPPLGHSNGIGNTGYLVCGMAFYGDGINDTVAQQVVNEFYDQFKGPTGPLGAKNFVAGNDGGTNSGIWYSSYFAPHLALVALAWYTATGENLFLTSNYFKYFPTFILYNILPMAEDDPSYPDGKVFLMHHDHHEKVRYEARKTWTRVSLGQAMYKDSDPDITALSNWLQHHRTEKIVYHNTETWNRYLGYFFLLGDRSVPEKSPTQLNLPLTKYFKNLGMVVMRQSFEDPNSTLIIYKAIPWGYTGGYWSAYDQGQFSIYKRGYLTFNTGSGAHHDYENDGYSRNIILFDVPGQNYNSSHSDKAGQRLMPTMNSIDDLVPGSQFDLGGIKRTRFESGEFDYIYSDLTRAYNSTVVRDNYPNENPVKISLFTREMVYMRPDNMDDHDYIFLFDRTRTVDAQIVKRWLLHMSFEPDINASGQSNGYPGQTMYPGADLVTITNTWNGSNGRLFSKTLLPANVNIVKIGGSGHAFTDVMNQQICDGYKAISGSCNSMTDEDMNYAGGWRIEVRPATQQQYDIFFHVFQTATASESSMEPVTLIDNQSNYYGAYIDHNVVMFSKTSDFQNQAQYQIAVSGNTRHLVCNLNPGVYRVYVDGNQITSVQVGDDGTAFFQHNGGTTFRVTKSNDTTPPAKPTGLHIEK